MTNDLKSVLTERGSRYGTFRDNAGLSQTFKNVAKAGKSYGVLSETQKEALDMIFHKIARILNGDPNYDDSWVDIAGYAQLEVNELKNKNE